MESHRRDGDLEALCYLVEECSPDGRKRFELLAVASNFDLARAAFDVGRTKTHPHRHLLLRQRARVIAKHAPSLSK
jgi:hypothetical protein